MRVTYDAFFYTLHIWLMAKAKRPGCTLECCLTYQDKKKQPLQGIPCRTCFKMEYSEALLVTFLELCLFFCGGHRLLLFPRESIGSVNPRGRTHPRHAWMMVLGGGHFCG